MSEGEPEQSAEEIELLLELMREKVRRFVIFEIISPQRLSDSGTKDCGRDAECQI